MAKQRMQRLASGCLTPVIVLVAASYGFFKLIEYQHHINLVPADLEVTGILYSNEENWGSILLPLAGDNETGILMYGLSAAVANKITTEGMSFFNRPENVARRIGFQRTHSEWHETPIAEGDDEWPDAKFGRKISSYLDKYGFGIVVDPSVESLVNDAVSKPGSFYSHGRTGLVIVIPKAKRVIFAYAG
ncbi:hypothetical protein [Bradyrhizobium sp. STM 3557]|uniref:hypothetical protein n=1 Tax=Bradyrhizobium sp. STM 3557 TaxID=578920 RepID=UPI00388F6609